MFVGGSAPMFKKLFALFMTFADNFAKFSTLCILQVFCYNVFYTLLSFQNNA